MSKFYKDKNFIKLQAQWYEKLKEDGFKDIEPFDPTTGLGQGSPFLKAPGSYTLGEIRRKFSPALQQHYNLARNFLAHGPFHSNLIEKYAQTVAISATYTNIGAFLADQDPYYDLADTVLWTLYSEGATLRQISDELRRLYRCRVLDRTAKRTVKRLPFSIFWSKQRVDKLKIACVKFNYENPEGLYYETDDQADQDDKGGSI